MNKQNVFHLIVVASNLSAAAIHLTDSNLAAAIGFFVAEMWHFLYMMEYYVVGVARDSYE